MQERILGGAASQTSRPSRAPPNRSVAAAALFMSGATAVVRVEEVHVTTDEVVDEAHGASRVVNKSPAKGNPAKHRVRHRKQRQGQTIFKGHPSWKMVINIKLGVAYSVGRHEDSVSFLPSPNAPSCAHAHQG